jgi:SRSO17 transposase
VVTPDRDPPAPLARQYCGALGKTANCQVAVSVSLANKTMSVPAAWRLYLPEAWATDPERRAAAGIPPEVGFLKKWEIALEEIDRLLAEDLPPAPVVADAGYGNTTGFRDALTERGFSYVVGIKGRRPRCGPRARSLFPRSPTRARDALPSESAGMRGTAPAGPGPCRRAAREGVEADPLA